MPVEQQITQILNSGNATVRAVDCGFYPVGHDLLAVDKVSRVYPECWYARSTINPAANLIEFRAVARGTAGADSIIVANEPEVACTGQLDNPPGFLFSDSFSGCLWFLFRDQHGSVYGSHCYRQSGQYRNPMPYINRIGGKLLYYFDTAGRFAHLGPNIFGSVICYVSLNKIVINFVAVNTATNKVVQVIDNTRIDNWRNFQIADPNIANALPPFVPPPQVAAPVNTGLKAKVATFFLKYL